MAYCEAVRLAPDSIMFLMDGSFAIKNRDAIADLKSTCFFGGQCCRSGDLYSSINRVAPNKATIPPVRKAA
ncbi:hypothetical protein D3C85_909030 [compost metagenome]